MHLVYLLVGVKHLRLAGGPRLVRLDDVLAKAIALLLLFRDAHLAVHQLHHHLVLHCIPCQRSRVGPADMINAVGGCCFVDVTNSTFAQLLNNI